MSMEKQERARLMELPGQTRSESPPGFEQALAQQASTRGQY